MKSLLIRNIKSLCGIRNEGVRMVKGAEMKELPSIDNAYMLIEGGIIKAFSSNSDVPERADEVIDATGKFVLPAWCDSHTHVVYAGTREHEFVDRINGLTYEQIAQRGGGILSTVKAVAAASEEQLFEDAMVRLEEMRSQGTGAVEIKSGYGLSYEGELKMLRVIRKLKEKSPLTIRATLLGAHAYPDEFKQDHAGYLSMLIDRLIPQVATERLADFIDVFCEKGYFTAGETERILEAGEKYGLRAKTHVNQFNIIGGVETSVKHKALSVDHLELVSEHDIAILQNSGTMPTALPGCSFFLRIPYTPVRAIIDAGLPLALATDYNPGSSPSGNMNMVVNLACTQMNMTPEEAVNAATLNSAYAMGVEQEVGSITIGKKANLIITKPIPSLAYVPYSFGSNLIKRIITGTK